MRKMVVCVVVLLVILFFTVKWANIKRLQRPSALISVRCSKCREPKVAVVVMFTFSVQCTFSNKCNQSSSLFLP